MKGIWPVKRWVLVCCC